jgi:hypothetical protein
LRGTIGDFLAPNAVCRPRDRLQTLPADLAFASLARAILTRPDAFERQPDILHFPERELNPADCQVALRALLYLIQGFRIAFDSQLVQGLGTLHFCQESLENMLKLQYLIIFHNGGNFALDAPDLTLDSNTCPLFHP